MDYPTWSFRTQKDAMGTPRTRYQKVPRGGGVKVAGFISSLSPIPQLSGDSASPDHVRILSQNLRLYHDCCCILVTIVLVALGKSY